MNPFKGRHFQRDIILWAVRWYWHNPSDLCLWHIDETYVKVDVRLMLNTARLSTGII
ncbi:TnpA [Serratia sp. M24T3]|nr:TnpA [Serratia sp. M24T3]